MKRIIIFTLMILPLTALYAKGIQDASSISDEKSRVSYAFGMAIGSNLSSVDLEFNYTAFAEGLKAIIENGETLFSEQESLEIIEAAIQKSMDKKAGVNMEQEGEFLAKNMERPEVKVTASGLQYEILTETTGEKPTAESMVRVHYEGAFIEGNVFDSSAEEENGVTIPLNRVIPGWSEGLMLMSAGSKYKFYIPSELAYGKEGIQPVIPPYSTLIFTVELLEILDEDNSDD